MGNEWKPPYTIWDPVKQEGVSDEDLKRIENNILFNNNVNSLLDIDGNVYKTVEINGQVWTADNWASTKYSDGTPIPQIQDVNNWIDDTAGAYCNYNGITKYGLLYNWFVVDPANINKIAPEGWRVPTYSNIQKLFDYLIENGYNYNNTIEDNRCGKSIASQKGWFVDTPELNNGDVAYNQFDNNSAGLSIWPNGGRNYKGLFDGIALSGNFWSSTVSDTHPDQAFKISIVGERNFPQLGRTDKNGGQAIKLVRDL